MKKKPRSGEMMKVSSLFDKYKLTLRAPEASIVKIFIEVVDDLYGWKLEKKHISYSPTKKVFYITAGGALKTEISLRKEEILLHITGRLGSKHGPKDIL